MPTRKLRCPGPPAGPVCGSYLGEIDRGKVRIFCARCKAHHELYISDLIEDLRAYLDSARQPANQFLEAVAHERRKGA
ncbi:hypothetical protein [Nitrobacter sp.]|jgi:hypothetical protein|uniref:hypothetical protein n=1 Tax=Nitrobacter sp. TaxID=29420 RepID=UPI003220437C